MGLDWDQLVKEIILRYEQGQLKNFPFITSDLKVEVCPGGAVRGPTVAGQKSGRFEPRYDLMMMNHHAMRRLAEAYGEGQAKGYAPNNWMLGIPESNCIKHAFAHLLMHLAKDKSEDHLGHLLFNIATLIYMQEERSDLMDLTGQQKD